MPEPKPYEWMFYKADDRTSLETMAQIRNEVESLPETRASFRLKDVYDLTGGNIPSEIIHILGSWEMPDRYSTSRALRYVNPNYPNVEMFTDLYVTCRCGAYMARLKDNRSWDGENEHTDECRQEWRIQARKDLIQMRKRWFDMAADLYLTMEDAAKRMGLRSHRTAVRAAKSYGINWVDRRMEGRDRTILTWRKLHDEYGYTYVEIAEAWGKSPATVRNYAGGYGNNIDV
jgi:hypothetical protein